MRWIVVVATVGLALGGCATAPSHFSPAEWARIHAAEHSERQARRVTPAAELTPQQRARTRTVTALTLTPAQTSRYQQALVAELRDPESARFRNVYGVSHGPGLPGICGEMNAKNAYGGYIGFAPFYGAVVDRQPAPVAVLYSGAALQRPIEERCRIGGTFLPPDTSRP